MTDPDINILIEKAMNKLSDKVKEKEKPLVENILRKVFIEGKTPKEAIGMTDKEIESLYAYAYTLFVNGKFKESKSLMEHLLSLDPQSRFALGAAAALHQLKNYEVAAGYYLIAFQLSGEQQDPAPFYYLYDCFKNLNDLESAALALGYVIQLAGEKPEHAVLKVRATKTQEVVFRDIRENNQKKAEESIKVEDIA